ncbi:cytochrome bc1 complex Rieske iron-sulfur subunit [Planctomonas deserti]|uniref:cytochrome bc1 complex Rieske iron-sulfur subunit n=1 Tax=Planctomonas deserti TaxID=2144185 RepID=UPI000D39B1FA|nr:Rieske 2Fe-2S domain-containing protein [Planctomonas deserti]
MADDHGARDVVSAGQSARSVAVPVSASQETSVSPGLGVIAPDRFENPGIPPHQPRVTDLDPKKEKRAERTVYTLFYLSLAGSVFAIAAYFGFPIEENNIASTRMNNLMIGIGISLALLAIGIAAVHWGKALMPEEEMIDHRHPVIGSPATRARAVEIFDQANKESGLGRRSLLRNSLIGALVAFPLPAIVLFRDLYPGNQEDPVSALSHTMWKEGVRLTRDPSGTPIRASEVTLGSAFHVIPEGLDESEHYLEEKAKAAVLLMRLRPDELNEIEERKSWSYDGIVAYSKICTHVGCPVALYEQITHHLLCPCHQSQFDVTNHCEVIFGPAARPLPQLPIAVDDEGYLIAQSDFTEPVGPSFWERASVNDN